MQKTNQVLTLKQKIKGVKDIEAYNKLIAQTFKQEFKLPEPLYTLKLSSGAQRPPERSLDYYYRAVSLLKKLVENPMGIKKIRLMYSKLKRGITKPPKLALASSYANKLIINQLVSANYLLSNKFGYYTSPKGKALLSKFL